MTVSKSPWHFRLLSRIYLILSIFIIAFALLVSVARLLLPAWLDDEVWVADWLSEKSGREIAIAGIRAEWHGLGPSVFVEQVEVRDAVSQRMLVTLEHGEFSVDFWRSLLTWSLRTEQVTSRGLTVSVEPDTGSVPHLRGDTLTRSQMEWQFRRALELLLNQSDITLTDSRIDYYRTGAAPLAIRIPEINVRNRRQEHQILARFTAGQGSGRLVIESEGHPLSDNSRVQAFLEGVQVPLALLSEPFGTSEVTAGQADLQLWLTRNNGQFSEGFLDLVISDLKFAAEPGAIPEAAHFRAQLRPQGDGWHLVSERIALGGSDPEQEGPALSLRFQPTATGSQWHLAVRELPAAGISGVLGHSGLLPEAASGYLVAAAPEGSLELLDLQWQLERGAVGQIRGDARVRDLSVRQVRKIPGFGPLQGDAEFRGEDGNFSLSGESAVLDFGDLFPAPLAVDRLEMTGAWQRQAGSFRLQAPHIIATTADAELAAAADYFYDAEAVSAGAVDAVSSKGELGIYGEVTNARAANAGKYLPVRIMSDKLVSLLTDGLDGGRLTFAQIAMRGPLGAFPFDNAEGQFATYGRLEQGRFRFDPEWPTLTGLDADLWFIGDSMAIDVDRARLLGMPLSRASARIPAMSAKPATLSIAGHAEGSGDKLPALLNASPLQEWLGAAFEPLTLEGPLPTDLQLELTLNPFAAKVRGKVRLADNALAIKPVNLRLEQLQGEVEFSEAGARAEQLTGRLLGGAFAGTFRQGGFADRPEQALIDFSGTAEAGKLGTWLMPAPGEMLAGTLDYQGHLTFEGSGDDSEMALIVQSGARDLAVRGPAPLAKEAGQRRPFQLSFAEKSGRADLRINWGAALKAAAQLKVDQQPWQIINGQALVGEVLPPETPEAGLVVAAYLPRADMGEWLDLVKAVRPDDSPGARPQPGRPSSASDWPVWLESVDVEIGQLDAWGFLVPHLELAARRPITDDPWSIELDSPDIVGALQWLPGGEKNWQFDRLVLNTPETSDKPEAAAKASTLQPADLAPMALGCQQCIINDMRLGSIDLILRRATPDKVDLSGNWQLEPVWNAAVTGDWQAADLNTSQINIEFVSDDIGQVLQSWGFGDSIRDSETEGQLAVNWPGSFVDFSLATMTGQLEFDVGKGSITDVSDKGARVFSLLSLQSLKRRLALDFSDLFSKGFFYDSIQGRFSIGDGKLTSEEATIKGTSADVEISGEVDLVDSTIDERITVFPKLNSSLPVLAGFALEPTTGLLIFLLNQMLEPALKVVSSIEYQVSGPLSDPVMTQVKKTATEVKIDKAELEKQIGQPPRQEPALEPETQQEEPPSTDK